MIGALLLFVAEDNSLDHVCRAGRMSNKPQVGPERQGRCISQALTAVSLLGSLSSSLLSAYLRAALISWTISSVKHS